jgi:hypothetical protein
MGVFDSAKDIAAAKARAARLKDYVLDKEPAKAAISDASRLVITGKALDIYGMVLTGIDFITTVSDALTIARTMHLLHETEMGLMSLQQASNIANLANTTSMMGAGRVLFAANIVGVLATYVGVWVSLGAGYAAAKADILTDHAMSGASRGAVLGANDAGPSYVEDNLWLVAKPQYPAFREAEGAARNMHNIALVAGYAQGKSLTRNQKGNLYRFLHSKMSAGSRSFYSGSWSDWGSRMKKDYYYEIAGVFRRELLRS